MLSLVTPTNSAALASADRAGRDLSRNIRRQSSGQASPQDGAAAYAIYKQLTAEITSNKAASRNVNEGISLAQTADGALQGMNDALGRMKELAVQAANGTLGPTEQAALNDEFQALKAQIGQTVAGTQFNGNKILDNGAPVQIQAGTGPTDQIAIQTAQLNTANLGTAPGGLAGADLTSGANAVAAFDEIAAAQAQVLEAQSNFGTAANELQSADDNIKSKNENYMAAASRLNDVDYAEESAQTAGNALRQRAALLAIQKSNEIQSTALRLLDKKYF